MGLGRFCRNCGYLFRGQRVGKCPNCDQSAYTESDKFYSINPKAIRQFEEFDRHGGPIASLAAHNKNIAIVEESPKGDWVTLSIHDIIVTFANYGKGPEVIAEIPNSDGYGINDIPSKFLAEATQVANSIFHGR